MVACPVNAITISPVGAKVILNDLCVGCKLCTIACPYGTMFYDPDSTKGTKCNLCGGAPACVSACPTQAVLRRNALKRSWRNRHRGQPWHARGTSLSAAAPPA